MTWHRGFVLCADSDSATVGALLDEVANAVLLVSCNGETAFAFTSRIVPDLRSKSGCVVGVDDGAANYFHEISGGFCPVGLVANLGLTYSLVVAIDSVTMKFKSTRKALAQLGDASDFAEADGRRAYRWDPNFQPGDSTIAAFSDSLASIETSLIRAGETYRIATFDDRFGAVRGEVSELEEVWTEPIAIVTIEWVGKSGELQSVTASDSEFLVDADNIPDIAF